VTVSADSDAENALRSAVLEFMDTVRRVEQAIAAGRRGEDVPEELDVAPLGDISEEEWRAYWPPAAEDTEPGPDRIPEPTPADVPEPGPVEVPEPSPVEVPEPSPVDVPERSPEDVSTEAARAEEVEPAEEAEPAEDADEGHTSAEKFTA
jgi:XTP/dITP diphosphohydrolase